MDAQPIAATKRNPTAPTAAVMAVVSVCGWMVMELEILGARILAPFFGSSIYVVMGSVVGVFLISLAVGYLAGGWGSEKAWGARLLGAGLVAAGVWLALLRLIVAPVCDSLLDAGLDEKWGSLVAALALFGAPTAVLGMVSPMMVRRLAGTAGAAGRSAGLVLCVSTVASFIGCLTTAFYLVLFSWHATLTWSGLALGAVGLAVLAAAGRPARAREEQA